MHPVAPALFRLVHRNIRPLDDVFRAGFVIDEQHHADARRAMVLDNSFCVLPR